MVSVFFHIAILNRCAQELGGLNKSFSGKNFNRFYPELNTTKRMKPNQTPIIKQQMTQEQFSRLLFQADPLLIVGDSIKFKTDSI